MQSKTFSYVTVPIGDYEDFTLKALRVLKESQCIICEELKPARKLLKHLGISFYHGKYDPKDSRVLLESFHENSNQDDRGFLKEVLNQVQRVSYISDCGSPIFEDPGNGLSSLLKSYKIQRVGGVSSLSYLMMYLPAQVKKFEMLGFLNRETALRKIEINKIKKSNKCTFLMETPYRLQKFVKELEINFKEWNVLFGYRLSMDNEVIIHGKVSKCLTELKKLSKGEFVLFIYP
ncbi:SAM-dependent methyltransferase [bacterium]|nr:SAM-dependent methyltransferase [bacterium]